METMRTPDGDFKPQEEALSEWSELYEPLCELGFGVIGFDPGVQFYWPACKGKLSSFTLPVDAIRAINNAIK